MESGDPEGLEKWIAIVLVMLGFTAYIASMFF